MYTSIFRIIFAEMEGVFCMVNIVMTHGSLYRASWDHGVGWGGEIKPQASRSEVQLSSQFRLKSWN